MIEEGFGNPKIEMREPSGSGVSMLELSPKA
jgi:hypothetical protein